MELASRVDSEVSKPFSKQDKGLLLELYREAFGSLNGLSMKCPSCKHDAFVSLSIWLKNNSLMSTSKLNLFTSYYQDKSPERQKEIDFCINFNRNSGFFDNVITIEGRRPTYKDFFELTKQYPDHVNVIANSDIFFNETILQAKGIRSVQCYALSRWDYVKGGMIKSWCRKDSQDAWIFRGRCLFQGGDFYTGTPGCDNRIAYELKQAGYMVTNPSKRIKAIHLHLSDVRNYTNLEKVDKPYLMVEPCH